MIAHKLATSASVKRTGPAQNNCMGRVEECGIVYHVGSSIVARGKGGWRDAEEEGDTSPR